MVQDYGIWWSNIGYWIIGKVSNKGKTQGIAYYTADEHCPHQFTQGNWNILSDFGWKLAGEALHISCKYITIKTIVSPCIILHFQLMSYQNRKFVRANNH